MIDVLIVGAGPAGSVAATVLARAGVRVRIVDRATFPRDKLCGDTVNPGTLARLRHLHMAEALDRDGLRIDGMLVSGDGGAGAEASAKAGAKADKATGHVVIEGRYPNDLYGRSISRSDLDWSLLQQALDAGAMFDSGVAVRTAVVTETRSGAIVEGVVLGSDVTTHTAGSLRARVTIAADGRRSTLAFGLGLAHHPVRPRRWAIGAYFEGALGATSTSCSMPCALGEMHIRRGRYIGVAPLPGGLTNVCVVGPTRGSGAVGRRGGQGDHAEDRLGDFRDPSALLRRELERDAGLRDRFAGARLVRPPVVLGPLAVDAVDRTIDGLILAGDAAGFIDPMTGDGMRFAVRGGELAAAAALHALEHGWKGVHETLAAARRQEFSTKWRFNRALRTIVASPLAVRMAAAGARLSPGLVRAIVARAGDCHLMDNAMVFAEAAAIAD